MSSMRRVETICFDVGRCVLPDFKLVQDVWCFLVFPRSGVEMFGKS